MTTPTPTTPLSGAWKGTILGMCNVVAIAFGLAVTESSAEVLPLVLVFGGVPGVTLGFLLGLCAGATARWHVIARLAMLILPSIWLVHALANEFRMDEYIVVSMIPTAVAGSILERWTRYRPAPPIPLAHVA